MSLIWRTGTYSYNLKTIRTFSHIFRKSMKYSKSTTSNYKIVSPKSYSNNTRKSTLSSTNKLSNTCSLPNQPIHSQTRSTTKSCVSTPSKCYTSKSPRSSHKTTLYGTQGSAWAGFSQTAFQTVNSQNQSSSSKKNKMAYNSTSKPTMTTSPSMNSNPSQKESIISLTNYNLITNHHDYMI